MQWLSAAMVILGGFLVMRLVRASVARLGAIKAVNPYRTKYISKTLNLGVALLVAILLILVAGVEYAQVSLFLSSVFAVIGVALFAQWSILSNITASLIIFFAFPYRVGDTVKIMDKDESVTGVIEEISLFHVFIRRGSELVTYPNSLILQKPVVRLEETQAGQESPAGEEL